MKLILHFTPSFLLYLLQIGTMTERMKFDLPPEVTQRRLESGQKKMKLRKSVEKKQNEDLSQRTARLNDVRDRLQKLESSEGASPEEVDSLKREVAKEKLGLQMAKDYWHDMLEQHRLTPEEAVAVGGIGAAKACKQMQAQNPVLEELRAVSRQSRRAEYSRAIEEEARLNHARRKVLQGSSPTPAPERDPWVVRPSSLGTNANMAILQRKHDAVASLRRPPTPEVSGIACFGDGSRRPDDIVAMVREPRGRSPLRRRPMNANGTVSALQTYSSLDSLGGNEFDPLNPEPHILSLNEMAVLSLAGLRQVEAEQALLEAERLTRTPREEPKAGEDEDPSEFEARDRRRLELRAVTFNNLALLHKQSHHVVEALQMLEKCMEIEERLGIQAGRTLLNLSTLLRMAGKSEDALLAARKAMQLLDATTSTETTLNLASSTSRALTIRATSQLQRDWDSRGGTENYNLHAMAVQAVQLAHQQMIADMNRPRKTDKRASTATGTETRR